MDYSHVIKCFKKAELAHFFFYKLSNVLPIRMMILLTLSYFSLFVMVVFFPTPNVNSNEQNECGFYNVFILAHCISRQSCLFDSVARTNEEKVFTGWSTVTFRR